MAHTLTYEVGLDEEVQIEGEVYYVCVEAKADFDHEGDPVETSIEITHVNVCGEDTPNLAMVRTTKSGDEIDIPQHPQLAGKINQLLWDAVCQFAEDNHSDIVRDTEEDYEAMRADWHAE
jgi:hypothetical protein